MVAWNIKLFLVAAALQPPSASAFFVPSVLQHKHKAAMRGSPDSWLGSSPSDHYGGAVGPEFEKMDGVDKKPTATIRPLDWNGGTMEAGFSQQLEQQREYDAGGKSFFPEKAEEEQEESSSAPVAQEETVAEPEANGQVAFEIRNEVGQRLGYATPSEAWEKEGSRTGDTIAPLEWSGGTMEDGFKKAQKRRPSRYLQAPFESTEVKPKRPYATLKQATPAGKPKTIVDDSPKVAAEQPSAPAPQEDPQAAEMSSVKFDDGTSEAAIYEKQKKYIPSGHPEHAFEAKKVKPQQDWRTLQQATPEGQPKMIGFEAPKKAVQAPKKPKQPEAAEWTEQQQKDYGPPQEGFPVRPFKSEPDQFGDWFENVGQVEQDPKAAGKKKRIPSGHHEQAFETQEVKPKQDWKTLEQATPEGQPKMIGGGAPKKVETPKKPQVPTAKNGAGPPREGFPVRPFKSEPDQFGDWFNHVDD